MAFEKRVVDFKEVMFKDDELFTGMAWSTEQNGCLMNMEWL